MTKERLDLYERARATYEIPGREAQEAGTRLTIETSRLVTYGSAAALAGSVTLGTGAGWGGEFDWIAYAVACFMFAIGFGFASIETHGAAAFHRSAAYWEAFRNFTEAFYGDQSVTIDQFKPDLKQSQSFAIWAIRLRLISIFGLGAGVYCGYRYVASLVPETTTALVGSFVSMRA